MTIGEQLKQIRKAYGLTQQQLAEQSGTSFSFINRVENGHTSIRLDTLNKVLALLGCEVSIIDGKSGKVIGNPG